MNENDNNTTSWELDLIGGSEEHHNEAREIIREASRKRISKDSE